MSNYVQPTEFINYISEFKKIFVTKVNSPVTQMFKIDSNISDQYYFQFLNKNNQVVSLEGRSFQIYGSIEDSKNLTHILFYTPSGIIEENNVLHFHINTYNQEYLNQIKTTKQANVTIVETTSGNNTQVVLRDVGLFYKRPYIDNVVPAEVYTVRILTGSLPWENEFGAGNNINLIEGTPNYAFGSNLSTASNQFVIGDTNTPDGTKAFIVANSGNVFTVDYEGNVEANSITINGSTVATAADLTGFATEDWVESQGYLTAHQSLDGYATEQWVQDQGYLTEHQSLADYATKVDLATTSATLEAKIPTYTAGSGISISNTNVISIDGELGKTYYADETTLHLDNSTNTFSIKSLSSKLNQGQNILLTEDEDGVITIAATGGGGSGTGGATYTAGTGLSLSTVSAQDGIYQFYVNQTWFANEIEKVTSGIQNLSAGTGLQIVDNIISVSAQYLTEADLTDYATKDYVTGQVSGKADLSAVTAVDDKFANYYTSAQVDSAIETAISTVPSTVYTGTDGIKVENGVISLTAALSSIDGYSDVATKEYVTEATSDFITAEDLPTQKTKLSQFNNDVGFITEADIPVVSDFVTESELQSTSAAIVEQIPSVEGLASETFVTNSIEAATSSLATEADLQIVSAAIPSVQCLATEQYVDSAVEAASGNLQTAINGKTTSGEVKTQIEAYGYQTATDVANAISGKADEDQLTAYYTKTEADNKFLTGHQSLDNYYTKSEVYTKAETDSAIQTASGNIENWADGKFLSAHQDISTLAEKTWVEGNFLSSTTSTAIIQTASGLAKDYVDTLCGQLSTAISSIVVPTKTSDLENDSDFVTYDEIGSIVEGYGFATESYVGTAIDELSSTYYNKTEVNTITGNLSAALVAELSGDDDTTYTGSESINITGDDNAISVDNDWLTGKIAEQIPPGSNYTAGFGLSRTDVTGGARFDLTGTVLTGSDTITISSNEISLTNASNYVKAGDNVSRLTNDAGYLTEHQSLADYTPLSTFTTVSGVVATISGDYVKSADIADFIDATSAETIATNVLSAASGTIVNTASSAIDSNYIEGLGFKKTDTTYTAGTGLKLDGTEFSLTATIPTVSTYVAGNLISITSSDTNEYTVAFTGTIPTVPTNVSEFENDATYISASQLEAVSGDLTGLLSATSATLDSKFANYALAEGNIDTSNISNYIPTISTYIGGTGISITSSDTNQYTVAFDNTSLGFVNSTQVGTQITDTVTKSFVTNLGIAETDTTYSDGNLIAITGTTNTINFTGTIPSNSEIGEIASAAVEDYITASGVVDGTGLFYDVTNNSLNINLSADANSNIKIDVDENKVVWLSATGGETVDVDTICGMLSSANENLTITKQDSKILFTATGGGGGVSNISGGPGIKISTIDGTTWISIATATIVVPEGETFNFDFRNPTASSVLYTSYTGTSTPTVTISGTLPEGISTTSVASGIQFVATSGADVTNTSATVNVVFDAMDVYNTAIVPVEITTIGHITETINAPASSWVFDFTGTNTITSSYIFTYSGDFANLTATVENLPNGFTASALSTNGISGRFDITGTTAVAEESTFNVTINLATKDAAITAPIVSIETQNVVDPAQVPLTFTGTGASNAVALVKGSGAASVNVRYKKGSNAWADYTMGDIITLNQGESVAFSGNNSTFNTSYSANNCNYFAMTGTIEAKGNVQSLLNFSDTVPNCAFGSLFSGCTSLVKAPELLGTNLLTGGQWSEGSNYTNMFYGCTNLTTPPSVLPATTLKPFCYNYMFFGCTSLTASPIICGTVNADGAIGYMFENCSNLSRVDVAFTSWTGNNFSNYWLDGVAANGDFYCPAGLNTTTRDISHVPAGWTVHQ